MEIKSYKCTMGKSEKRFTLLFTLLITGIVIGGFFYEVKGLLIAPIILFISLVTVYALVPKKLIITEDKIVVKRLFKDFVIPAANILAVSPKEKAGFMKDVKVFGAAGLFGYYGYFRSSIYGKYYCISNNKSNNIFLVTTKGSFQLSCDNSQEAIITVSKLLK